MVLPPTDYNDEEKERNRHYYRYILALALTTLLVGTIFYHLVEKLSWVNAYYFSVVTLSTVGYGDITPHTDFEKIFTTFYIFIGVGILATFLTVSMNHRMERRQGRSQRRKTKSGGTQKRSD